MVSKYFYYCLSTYLSFNSFLLTLTRPRRRRPRRGSLSSPRRPDEHIRCATWFISPRRRSHVRQHRASSSSQSASPYSPGGLGSHDPPDATDLFLPIPIPIPSSLSTTSRSTVAVTRGRILVDIGNILRYWVPNYRLTRYLTPRPRRQTCPFETATCGAVSPFSSACATTTDLDPSHLTRRAAVLVDARAFPVGAPSTTSR